MAIHDFVDVEMVKSISILGIFRRKIWLEPCRCERKKELKDNYKIYGFSSWKTAGADFWVKNTRGREYLGRKIKKLILDLLIFEMLY